MPVMDGYEATKAIRELEIHSEGLLKKSYIIGLTAHTSELYKI